MNSKVIDWRTLGLKEGHECETINESCDVHKNDGEWQLVVYGEGVVRIVITHCPYCGVKL